MITCYIGLGSNLGNRQKNINLALDSLQKDPAIKVLKTSTFRETAPFACPTQPNFLNGVVKLKTSHSPRQLLECLQEVERKLGRKRPCPQGLPRTIDLDILLYGDLRVNEEDLQIPHLRMREREFVLTPLREIAPQLPKNLCPENRFPPNSIPNYSKTVPVKAKTIAYSLKQKRKANMQNSITARIILLLAILFCASFLLGQEGLARPEKAELAELTAKNLPITIKYPANWFAKEDTDPENSLAVLYLSREKIKQSKDAAKLQVGVTLVYSKDYFGSDNLSWEQFTKSMEESAGLEGYKISNISANIEHCGWPAYQMVAENPRIKLSAMSIKVNNDVLTLTQVAPPADYGQYEQVFAEMLSSLTIRK